MRKEYLYVLLVLIVVYVVSDVYLSGLYPGASTEQNAPENESAVKCNSEVIETNQDDVIISIATDYLSNRKKILFKQCKLSRFESNYHISMGHDEKYRRVRMDEKLLCREAVVNQIRTCPFNDQRKKVLSQKAQEILIDEGYNVLACETTGYYLASHIYSENGNHYLSFKAEFDCQIFSNVK